MPAKSNPTRFRSGKTELESLREYGHRFIIQSDRPIARRGRIYHDRPRSLCVNQRKLNLRHERADSRARQLISGPLGARTVNGKRKESCAAGDRKKIAMIRRCNTGIVPTFAKRETKKEEFVKRSCQRNEDTRSNVRNFRRICS